MVSTVLAKTSNNGKCNINLPKNNLTLAEISIAEVNKVVSDSTNAANEALTICIEYLLKDLNYHKN